MSARDFTATVEATITRHAMLPSASRTLVACSGGGDSIALLHLLHRLGHAVAVAHLDHASRPDSASAADWVGQQAAALGVPALIERHPIAEEAATLGHSFEMHARDARYAFLAMAARALDCDRIATGHTRSDQAETLLMRILRGTSVSGLAGIPPVGSHHGLPVVRPLFECSRDEVREWLRQESIPWLEDNTNEDTDILRNRARLELLPALAGVNPAVETALARLAENARVDDDCLRDLARAATDDLLLPDDSLDRAGFACHHPSLQHRVVLGWLAELGFATNHDHVAEVRDFILAASVGARLSLPGGSELYAGRDAVELASRDTPALQPLPLSVPGTTDFGPYNFTVSRVDAVPSRDTLAKSCGPHRQYLDARAVEEGIIIRQRIPGDRMTPMGAPGSRKLSDVLIDRGIPEPRRDSLPLLVSGNAILWFPGGPVSLIGSIKPDTTSVILVETTCAT